MRSDESESKAAASTAESKKVTAEPTNAQRCYLWEVDRFGQTNIGYSEFADYYKVAKQPVNDMFNLLRDNGYLESYIDGNKTLFSLSEKANEYLIYYRHCYDMFKRVHQDILNMSLKQINDTFRTIMCSDFPYDYFTELEQTYKTGFYVANSTVKLNLTPFDDGEYELPFDVLMSIDGIKGGCPHNQHQKSSGEGSVVANSMGNSALIHPAKFVVSGANAYIEIRSKKDYRYHVSQKYRPRGNVESIMLQSDRDKWVPIPTPEKDVYRVPLEMVMAKCDFAQTLRGAFINIRVTITNEAMPKNAVCTLKFFFDKLKKL